ncbi:homoserine kinase [Nocardioides insulae]|uniref:homoserine kinase n=1 Tax=Nocardioides insulae TaxID=394734 RepID=UPI00041F7BD4|nr:homoserine kinase [Nocardioides insulae]
MTTFVDGPVQVSVPATSANLGPGYDSLGLALSLRDELEAEVLPEGLVVQVEGEGSDGVPTDESHLVVRAMRAAFTQMGAQPPGLRLTCKNSVPHARGLGSSSAAIVGGVVLARALVAGGSLLMDDEAAFRLTAELEGHPDNVAPAFYGGFVISGADEDGFFAVGSSVDPRVSAVVFIPAEGVETKVARGLLPERVPHRDAAADAGRAALLVAALAGRPEQLLRATQDYLHQQYRRPAMPASLDLVDRLRAAGVPAVVSGAGPTVLAFCDDSQAAALETRCPRGWRSLHLDVDPSGARLE